METILYVVIGVGVLLVIIGLATGKKGHRRHSSDGGGGSDSWDSDSDGGSDSGCSSGCGGGD